MSKGPWKDLGQDSIRKAGLLPPEPSGHWADVADCTHESTQSSCLSRHLSQSPFALVNPHGPLQAESLSPHGSLKQRSVWEPWAPTTFLGLLGAKLLLEAHPVSLDHCLLPMNPTPTVLSPCASPASP